MRGSSPKNSAAPANLLFSTASRRQPSRARIPSKCLPRSSAISRKIFASITSESEIFLDMADDLGKHLLGILARDGCLRDAVEKRKLAGAALFFGGEPRIFHRER